MAQERRKEARFIIPDIYRGYVTMKIKAGNDLFSADLLDFSRHGVRFRSPVSFPAGSLVECVLSIPRSLSKEIAVTLRIAHCADSRAGFTAGAEIDTVSDEMWFKVFVKVHDFIVERAGRVY
ncbi:MAG: PilZ domain-containing protein [Nitrospiraceae bacterium]|nr:PilZ domain-containing protein [Nitrospiraceae bacterium]